MSSDPSARRVDVVDDLEVSADRLWLTISDFEHIDRWTHLKVRFVEGNSIGCLRTVEMESGILVTERLVDRNFERMSFTYEIVEPNTYSMRAYRSTMRVQSLSAQRSRLHWEGLYTPAENADPAKTDKLLNRVYVGGIDLLRTYFSNN